MSGNIGSSIQDTSKNALRKDWIKLEIWGLFKAPVFDRGRWGTNYSRPVHMAFSPGRFAVEEIHFPNRPCSEAFGDHSSAGPIE